MPTQVDTSLTAMEGISDDALQQRIDAAIDAPEDTSYRDIYYGISVAGYNLLLDQQVHCEVIDFINPAPLPNTPEHFSGLCNLRGNLVPVYKLCRANEQPKRYIFIVDTKNKSAAIALDQLPTRQDIGSLERQAVEATKLTLIGQSSHCCYQIDNKTWFLINHQELFWQLANNQTPLINSSDTLELS